MVIIHLVHNPSSGLPLWPIGIGKFRQHRSQNNLIMFPRSLCAFRSFHVLSRMDYLENCLGESADRHDAAHAQIVAFRIRTIAAGICLKLAAEFVFESRAIAK